ncbi:MAG: hypothetical protein ABIF77_10245, partial [bacterium]
MIAAPIRRRIWLRRTCRICNNSLTRLANPAFLKASAISFAYLLKRVISRPKVEEMARLFRADGHIKRPRDGGRGVRPRKGGDGHVIQLKMDSRNEQLDRFAARMNK